MKEKIVLIGGGGHARVVIDAILNSKRFSIYGIADANLPPGRSLLGVRIIGSDDMLPEVFRKGIKNAFITVGSIGNCDVRKRIYNNLKNMGFRLPLVRHPKAVIANSVKFEEGTFVAAGAVINPCVKIGKNVIVNTSSSIDHDCIIGDFVHIAPGATLSGGVIVGEEAHIGTGAKVIQNIRIIKEAMIPAGSVIIRDVTSKRHITIPGTYTNEFQA